MSIDVNSSYLSAIRDSVGSHMFRHLFMVDDHGDRQDILQNGKLSCAYYVAFILYHFHLIKTPHATVQSTVRDLEASGWHQVAEPIPGDVLVWEPSDIHAEGAMHEHIGFYLDHERAVSNSSQKGEIVEHDWTFGVDNQGNPNRRVIKILRLPSLQPSA